MNEEYMIKNRKYIILIAAFGIVLAISDAVMSFSSNNIPIVISDGKAYLIRPEAGAADGHIRLKAKVRGDGISLDKNYDITLRAYADKEAVGKSDAPVKDLTAQQQAEYEMRLLSGSFNKNLSENRVLLPAKLKSGARIEWAEERSSHAAVILMITLIAMAALYKSRFTYVRKQKEKQRESVIRQLPEFVNRLVLLLNAGLVINTAFEKSIEDCMEFADDVDDYFCENMRSIFNKVRYANGSVNNEFREFARSSGIKELMRVSSVINDNIHKGVMLGSKLETESQMLWIERKKNCEERSKLAETKLTGPLAMFLLVLIIITAAPALIEL